MAHINLYEETTADLARHNKTWDDVKALLIRDKAFHPCFASQLLDIPYNNGYGGNCISLDFKIVGEDWWLERAEYDGSEWWEFKTMPTLPDAFTDISEFAKLVTA